MFALSVYSVTSFIPNQLVLRRVVPPVGSPRHRTALRPQVAAAGPLGVRSSTMMPVSIDKQPPKEYMVFISHAGEDKKHFVSCLKTLLEVVWNVPTFLDEHALQCGERNNADAMERQLRRVPLVILVLNRFYVTKKWPMWELGLVMQRISQEDSTKFNVLPALLGGEHGLAVRQLADLHAIYDCGVPNYWCKLSDVPSPDTREQWAGLGKSLSQFVCQRSDQNSCFEGDNVVGLTVRTVELLQEMGFLPDSLKARNAWQISEAEADVQGKVAASDQVDNAAKPISKGPPQVLWVDDDPENIGYAVQLLKGAGCIFSVAVSTTDALQLDNLDQFDVIISDMKRGADTYAGYELLRKLQARRICRGVDEVGEVIGKRAPFIIYSGSAHPVHVAEAKAAGAFGQACTAMDLFGLVMEALRQQQ